MSPAQSRGTVRLALKQVGLQPDRLSVAGLEVVFNRVMPRELRVRGFKDGELICRDLVAQLRATDFESSEDPESEADSALGRIFGPS